MLALLYYDIVIRHIESKGNSIGFKCNSFNNSFACRGWADDLILLSKSKKNMQKLIDETIRVFN